MSWTDWRIGGTANIDSGLPAGKGRNKVNELLSGTVREFALLSRKFYDVCDELPFTYGERQTHSVLFPAFAKVADLAFLEQPIVRSRPIGLEDEDDTQSEASSGRGGHGWVDYWVQHRDMVCLIEAKHAWLSCRSEGPNAWVKSAWSTCLRQLTQIYETGAPDLVVDEQLTYVIGLMIVVHYYGGKTVISEQPSQEECWTRHMGLIEGLAPASKLEEWPINWHAVWRLPPGLAVQFDDEPNPWMRYPAVSFVASAFPLVR